MLRLDAYCSRLRQPEDENRSLWFVFATLVSVIFSLWRAVFLIQTERHDDDEMAHAVKLLGILIESNAIGFPQDVATAHWSAGYYVQNALFRLHALTEFGVTSRVLSDETIDSLRISGRTAS